MQSGQSLTIGIWRGMWNASQFLDLYLGELKGNGVQSYRRVFPRAKYQSAKASASRMLNKPSIDILLRGFNYPYILLDKGMLKTINKVHSL